MGATGNLLEKYGMRCWNVAEQGALYFEKKVVEGLYLHKNVLTSGVQVSFQLQGRQIYVASKPLQG